MLQLPVAFAPRGRQLLANRSRKVARVLPWLIPLAQSVLSAQQNAQNEDAERRDAIANVHAQRAASLGYPSYGVQAARTNAQLDDQYGARNPLAALIPLLMSRKEKAK